MPNMLFSNQPIGALVSLRELEDTTLYNMIFIRIQGSKSVEANTDV